MKNTIILGLLLQFLLEIYEKNCQHLQSLRVGERQQSARPQFHHKTLSDTQKTAEVFS